MGKISDLVRNMIESALDNVNITSANPSHINELHNDGYKSAIQGEDFEAEIEQIIKDQSKSSPQQSSDNNKLSGDETKKKIKETEIKVDDMLNSNLGDIKSMSTEQFGNIRQVATNPFGFMTRTLLRKLRTGAGLLFVVAIAVEVAKFLIDEMFKPGRAFDQRFREQINHQIIQFTSRKEQEELRAGYKSVITTTMGGLRGGMLRGQIGGNFYSSPFVNNTIYDNEYQRFPSRALNDMRKKDITQSPLGLAHANNRDRT